MISLLTAYPSPFQWGPVIVGLIVLLASSFLAVFAWATRRLLARIDTLATNLEGMNHRLTVVETVQTMSDRNVRTTARRVGVPSEELEDTIDRRLLIQGQES